MDTLQNELDTTYPLMKIKLLGVNLMGHESGNSLIVSGRDLPMLQDVDANQDGQSDAWTLWNAEWRDLVILDAQNAKLSVFNLTEHNLAVTTEYETLRDMLLDAAMAGQKPWTNAVQANDVDADGVVAPRDVLVTINSINRDGSRELPPPTGTSLPPLRYDVNGDRFISPGDVLQVVNYINAQAAGEGEAGAGLNARINSATASINGSIENTDAATMEVAKSSARSVDGPVVWPSFSSTPIAAEASIDLVATEVKVESEQLPASPLIPPADSKATDHDEIFGSLSEHSFLPLLELTEALDEPLI